MRREKRVKKSGRVARKTEERHDLIRRTSKDFSKLAYIFGRKFFDNDDDDNITDPRGME